MTRTDTITDDLRQDILSGVFPPGDRLVELQLTQRYDCGRATVRGALVELATEGLVDREANRGATVRRISVGEAIEITEARGALESLVASHAARHASAEERVALRCVVADMREAVAADSTATYAELNRQFHRLLREMSGHSVAADLVANLRDRAAYHQYRLAIMPGRAAVSVEQHAAIASAIENHDEATAAAAMDAHLRSVIEVLRRWGDAGPI